MMYSKDKYLDETQLKAALQGLLPDLVALEQLMDYLSEDVYCTIAARKFMFMHGQRGR